MTFFSFIHHAGKMVFVNITIVSHYFPKGGRNMTENDNKVQKLVWVYQHPSKKDHTLLYKLLQAYLIAMGVVVGITVFIGAVKGFEAYIELLKVIGIIGGFLAVVMALCYPFTLLLIRFLTFLVTRPLKWEVAASEKGKKDNLEKKFEGKKKSAEKSNYISYRFMADGEKLHSWSVVETKGGKHIRYRAVRKLVRNKSQNRIKVHTLLGRTYVYATDEDYETVWDFLSAHCTDADIYDDDEPMNVSKGE